MHALGDAPQSWPLAWPSSVQRWEKLRQPDPFRVSLAQARGSLLRELRLANITGVVISSNAALRRDGQIAAQQGRSDDPGVAVYGERGGKRLVFAVDRFGNVAANVRAIAKTIDAIRGQERWGTTQIVDAAFAGFAALPSGTPPNESAWWAVLDVAPDTRGMELAAAYRRLARIHHPDAGGDPERFRAITAAFDAAKDLP